MEHLAVAEHVLDNAGEVSGLKISDWIGVT